MKNLILISFLTLLLLFQNVVSDAQIITNHVIVANGGAYSNPDDYVTLTAYDPESGNTETIATIFTQSVQGLFIHEGFAYVAAQDSLAKINIDEGRVDAIVALPGVNKFAIYQDKLLVSRQYPATSDFVQIRNLSDLSFIASFPEISDGSWEILIAGDTAYVSVTGGWAATEGKMAVLDARTNSFVREMNFGPAAVGIGPSFQDQENILFVCKTPWGGTNGTIVKYNLTNGSYTTIQTPHFYGDAAGFYDGKLYLVIDQGIGIIDAQTLLVIDANLISNPFSDLEITGLVLDRVEEKIYVNYSWWVAPPGTGRIYNLNGDELGTYDAGISAEEVAVDYRDITAAEQYCQGLSEPVIYPNPCKDFMYFDGFLNNAEMCILDISGRQVLDFRSTHTHHNSLDLRSISPGVYFVKIIAVSQTNDNEKGIYTYKIVKTP